MAKNPRKKRTIGEDPVRGLYSPYIKEEIKEPNMNPASSGRMYCTVAAR